MFVSRERLEALERNVKMLKAATGTTYIYDRDELNGRQECNLDYRVTELGFRLEERFNELLQYFGICRTKAIPGGKLISCEELKKEEKG